MSKPYLHIEMLSYAWDHKGKILCLKIPDPRKNEWRYASSIDISDCMRWFHIRKVCHLVSLPKHGYNFDNQPVKSFKDLNMDQS